MTPMVNIDQSNIYTPLHLSVLGAIHLSHTCKCDNYVVNICMSIHHMYNIHNIDLYAGFTVQFVMKKLYFDI